MRKYYGDILEITDWTGSFKSVVIDGNPSFMERLKLAWKILRGMKN